MESHQWLCKELLCGGAANAIGIIFGNPFDVVKVRLQSMPGTYKSPIHCFRSIVKYEGISGLFKGVWSPTLAQFFMGALSFAGNSVTKSILEPNLMKGEPGDPICGYVAGCVGGLVQCIVLVPSDLVKCKLQVNNVTLGTSAASHMSTAPSAPSYSGSWDCVSKIFLAEGVRGLFRGFWVTCLRDVPSCGVYFVSYSHVLKFLSPIGEPSVLAIMFAGGLAGSLSWLVVYPVDVIKTNLQLHIQPVAKGAVPAEVLKRGVVLPNSMLAMAKYLYKNHGPKIFSVGLGTTMIRAFPVNALVFLCYENFRSFSGL